MLYNESLTKPKSRKVPIFLFLLFIIMFIVLFVWVQNIYKTTTALTQGEGGEQTSCWAYVYEIKNVQYENNTLSFDLENKPYSDGRISMITIITGREERSVDFYAISKGLSRKIKVEDIEIKDKFLYYIQNCKGLSEEYNI